MILQALAKYYENLAEEEKVPKPGWCSAKVSYQIDLSEEGEVKGIISLKTEEERGKKTVQVPQVLLVPEMVTRSSGAVSYTHLDVYKRQSQRRLEELFTMIEQGA